MTAKEAMRIIEHRHLTAPEAYEVIHALFDAEKRETALEKLCDDAMQLDGERECWLSERSVRDVLSPPSSWPTNEAESEAETKRDLAPNEQVQVRVEPHGPAPAAISEGLREALGQLLWWSEWMQSEDWALSDTQEEAERLNDLINIFEDHTKRAAWLRAALREGAKEGT